MQTAFVTGASRGVGRGVAISLAECGYKVFATGRSIEAATLPRPVVKISFDHLRDEETAAAFSRVADEAGQLDLLVNCAWGGYEKMVENGNFTWTLPFWEQPAHRWTSMIDGAFAPRSLRGRTPRGSCSLDAAG
jgi:dehydrogenase/reductase SDR family protein 1